MFLKRVSHPLIWGIFAAATFISSSAVAQEPSENLQPLNQPSIPESVDRAAGGDQFWSEHGIAADAKWIFGIEYSEARIQKRSERFESLYLDLLKQQGEGKAIVRTQDLPSLFNTSLSELQK